jgi:hypothetical protein
MEGRTAYPYTLHACHTSKTPTAGITRPME